MQIYNEEFKWLNQRCKATQRLISILEHEQKVYTENVLGYTVSLEDEIKVIKQINSWLHKRQQETPEYIDAYILCGLVKEPKCK